MSRETLPQQIIFLVAVDDPKSRGVTDRPLPHLYIQIFFVNITFLILHLYNVSHMRRSFPE